MGDGEKKGPQPNTSINTTPDTPLLSLIPPHSPWYSSLPLKVTLLILLYSWYFLALPDTPLPVLIFLLLIWYIIAFPDTPFFSLNSLILYVIFPSFPLTQPYSLDTRIPPNTPFLPLTLPHFLCYSPTQFLPFPYLLLPNSLTLSIPSLPIFLPPYTPSSKTLFLPDPPLPLPLILLLSLKQFHPLTLPFSQYSLNLTLLTPWYSLMLPYPDSLTPLSWHFLLSPPSLTHSLSLTLFPLTDTPFPLFPPYLSIPLPWYPSLSLTLPSLSSPSISHSLFLTVPSLSSPTPSLLLPPPLPHSLENIGIGGITSVLLVYSCQIISKQVFLFSFVNLFPACIGAKISAVNMYFQYAPQKPVCTVYLGAIMCSRVKPPNCCT